MSLAPAPLAADRMVGRPVRPAVAAAAALGVCAVVNVIDPNEPGSLGLCPFKWVTGGLDCPGCGTLRATRALTRGNLGAAVDHNLVFVALVPLLLWGLVAWWRHERGQRPRAPRVPTQVMLGLSVLLPVWWVRRNLPMFEWFASGLS